MFPLPFIRLKSTEEVAFAGAELAVYTGPSSANAPQMTLKEKSAFYFN